MEIFYRHNSVSFQKDPNSIELFSGGRKEEILEASLSDLFSDL